ncbi:oxidized low-density lipoprotein receptor 1-like [Alligator sinensis]|uniref:Oxidized low-density lipoprotein receptor 1-like n=1 Tax=Alligator sinensis TaxID=38654 RepID=A0A3Q0FUP5_ALLSI|nr:oxidized low-density lipoprotein receptor 1-like [Alligator sinensis]
MSEHVITYLELKYDQSKRLKHGDKDPSATPIHWQLTTLVLGILCLMLLIARGALGYNEAQLGREQENLVKQVENLTSELTSCQEPSLPGSQREQPQDTGEKCPARWVVHKDSSYLFSPEKGTWEKCHSSCILQSAQLFTIEGGEELDFIKKELYEYFEDHGGVSWYYPFWIGLSYNPGSRKWVWKDNTDLSSFLFVLSDPSPQNYRDGACAFLQGEKVKPGGCGDTWFCICETKKKAQGKNKLV